MTLTTKGTRRLRQVLVGIVAGMTLVVATMPHLHAQSQGSAVGQETMTAEDPRERDTLMFVGGVIGLALQGITDPARTAPVRFATEGAMPRPDPAILEGGFYLVSVTAVPYDKAGGEESGRTVGGVLLHRDRFGRYISTRYAAYYRVAPDGSIVVHSTTVEPIDTPVPKISIYIVPAERVISGLLKTQPVITLLQYVANNAVPRFKTRKADRGEKDYYVFAFFMDRLAEDAKVGLLIGDQPGGFTGHGRDTLSFQENGWHVAYTPVRFALDCTPQVFFKVVYTPGTRVSPDRRERMLVAVFTSDSFLQQIQRLLAKRGYNPGPIDGMMGPRTREAIRQFQQDRKLSVDGEPSVFLLGALNTSDQPATTVKTTNASTPDPGMVRKVQWGLAQWGYDPGPADGVLGQRTRQAIREFQRDQGLTVDGRPSAQLAAMVTDSRRQGSASRSQVRSKAWPNKVQRP